MIKYLRTLSNNQFLRHVITLASGTALAQIITLALAPIITRLYGPEAYGMQGIFLSLVMLLSTVSALGYPTAIVLPKQDKESIAIVKLAIFVSLITTLLILAFIFFAEEALLDLFNAQAIGKYVFLVPLATLASALSATLGQWLIRKKAYSLTARFSVLGAGLINTIKVGVGIFQPSVVALILTNVCGSFLVTFLTYRSWLRSVGNGFRFASLSPDLKGLIALARKYSDFPLLRTPQNFINAVSRGLPILLLGAFFGAATAGQYGIAISLLSIPAVLIGGSVQSVFYPRITEAVHKKENIKLLIIQATGAMIVVGFAPYLAITLAGPSIFSFIFGAEWEKAGLFAQWLAPWLFFQFINKPSVAAIPALKLQGGLLIYEIFSTGTKLLALWLGLVLYEDALVSIALYSIFGVIAYIGLILWVINRSGRHRHEEHIR